MPSRDFQLHFCQSLAGLSNEGPVDQGDSSHSHQLVPIQNWTGSLVCSGLHPFRAICIKTHCIKNGVKKSTSKRHEIISEIPLWIDEKEENVGESFLLYF